MLRKADKKRDRQILFGHRQSLLEKLQGEIDPAMVGGCVSTYFTSAFCQVLHLAVLILFHQVHGSMLQVSHVLSFICSSSCLLRPVVSLCL